MTRRNDGAFKLAERLALRPAEAARALGISERKLRQLLPKLPIVREGGVVLLPVDGLRAWLLRCASVEGDEIEGVARETLRKVRADGKWLHIDRPS